MGSAGWCEILDQLLTDVDDTSDHLIGVGGPSDRLFTGVRGLKFVSLSSRDHGVIG